MRPSVYSSNTQICNPNQCRTGAQRALYSHFRFYRIEFLLELFPLVFNFQLGAPARELNDFFIQHIKTSFSYPIERKPRIPHLLGVLGFRSIGVHKFGITKNQITIKTVRPVTASVANIQITSFPGISFLAIERKFGTFFFFKYPSMLYLKSFHS